MLVLIMGFGNVLLTSVRWSYFLPGKVPYGRLTSFCLIGYFFNTFLPGRIGGDIIKALYLYRDIGKGAISIASVLMDRYVGLSAMIGMSLIAYAAGYRYIEGTQIAWLVPSVSALFLVASFIVWRVNWGRIKGMGSLYTPMMEYKKDVPMVSRGLTLSFLVQLICIMEVYLLSVALGLSVPVIYFLIFVPIINAVAAIPVTVAGLGLRELGFTTLFGMFFSHLGVTSNQAVSLSLLFFAAIVIINTLGGLEYIRVGILSRKTGDY